MNRPFKPEALTPILADIGVSISDLKRNPAAVVEAARKQQVAILNRNRAVAYVVSPEVWDHVLDVMADRSLVRKAQAALVEEGDDVVINLDAYL